FGTPQSCRGSSTGKFRLPSAACLIFAFCIAAAIASPAQTFTTLVSFDGTNGAYPSAGLAQGPNGNFYGTTYGGGANNEGGTIFETTPAGVLTTFYDFCAQSDCSDGSTPDGLMLAANGNFYGVTESGGVGRGTIFEITPTGQLTTIYSFCFQNPTDCENHPRNPEGTLAQGRNGNLYGTTSNGGNFEFSGPGTVFEITPAGKFTTLYNFC
ncbi:MAG: choice-of-anchor tandem repeat GloVer-containing protein, partial [Candidatus Sulfotelmatobacter sp.]